MQNLSKVLRLDFKKIIIKEQVCGKVFRIKFFLADLKYRYPPGGDVDYPRGGAHRATKTKTVVKVSYN